MIADQLEKSVLQAAIQGKLTQQLPEDCDAQDLLEEIKKEKARLIKEGKIKKEKLLPDLKEDEIPFDIPENWRWTRFGNIILQNIGGGTPSKANSDYWNGSIPWASVKDLNCKVLISTKDRISQAGLVDSSSNLIPKGNLIVCTRMGLGKIVYNTIDVAINQDLRALFLSEKINKWYFYYFYLTLNFEGKGATVKGISIDELSNTLFSVPPIAEQNRIVEQIEKLLPEIEALKTDECKLDVLQKAFPQKMRDSILQYAVEGKLTEQLPSDGDARDLLKEIQKEKAHLINEGKIRKEKPLPEITEDETPFDIPANWCWVRLEAITSTLGDGIHGTPNYTNNGEFSFINGNNLSDGKIVIKNDTKKVTAIEYKKYQKSLDETTILVSINGTIGNVAFYNQEKIILGKSASYFNLMGNISKYYMKILIKSKYFLTYACGKATGSTIKNVSLQAMRDFPVPLPPKIEQARIVERLEKLLPEIDKLKID
jgi:type I restriction enzyme, S subunit